MSNVKSGLDNLKQVIKSLESSVKSFTKEGQTYDLGVRLFAILNYLDCLEHEGEMVLAVLKDAKKKAHAPVLKKAAPKPVAKAPVKAPVKKAAPKVVNKPSPKVVKKVEIKKPVAKPVVKKACPKSTTKKK